MAWENHPLHDWLPGGHGTISLQEALTQSCDTCFYQVAAKLDSMDQGILPHAARGFGFGATGIIWCDGGGRSGGRQRVEAEDLS